MGKMYVLFETDDKKISWDTGMPEEICAAKLRFEEYLKHGHIACKIEEDGKKGVTITEFDPEAEEIVLLSMVEGG